MTQNKPQTVRAYNKQTGQTLPGMLARFPKAVVPMHSRWTGMMEYIMEYQPNNKQMLRKISKMIARHES